MKLPEETLEAAETQAIESANALIAVWGEMEAARLLRICRGVFDRKIAECERVEDMRNVFGQHCEQEIVPKKKFVPVIIAGGLA